MNKSDSVKVNGFCASIDFLALTNVLGQHEVTTGKPGRDNSSLKIIISVNQNRKRYFKHTQQMVITWPESVPTNEFKAGPDRKVGHVGAALTKQVPVSRGSGPHR